MKKTAEYRTICNIYENHGHLHFGAVCIFYFIFDLLLYIYHILLKTRKLDFLIFSPLYCSMLKPVEKKCKSCLRITISVFERKEKILRQKATSASYLKEN